MLTYVLDPADCIVEIDGPWDAFAAHNGAPKLTRANVLWRPLFSFVTGLEMQELLRLLLKRVREGEAVSLDFRCDAPDERRYLRLDARPMAGGAVELRTTLQRSEPRPTPALLDITLPRGDDVVVVCSWCRRIRVGDAQWAEVEEAIARLGLFEAPLLPVISHGLCQRCAWDLGGRFRQGATAPSAE